MSASRTIAIALGAGLLLVGAGSEAQADRNQYTRLAPGQHHRYYGYHHRFAPYGYYGPGPGYGYGYGYRFGGYGYRPRYRYYEPY